MPAVSSPFQKRFASRKSRWLRWLSLRHQGVVGFVRVPSFAMTAVWRSSMRYVLPSISTPLPWSTRRMA